MVEAARLVCRSAPVADPGGLLRLAAVAPAAPIFFWENPASGTSMLAVGAAREIVTSGPERFLRAEEEIAQLAGAIERERRDTGEGPLLVGGYAFGDRSGESREWREFPPFRLFLPSLLWVRDARGCRLTRIAPPGGEAPLEALLERMRSAAGVGGDGREGTSELLDRARPSAAERASWVRRVAGARRDITAGELDKVVLARRLVLRAARPFDASELVARALAARPSCTSFWFVGGETSFVGSTPELLVRLSGRRVESGALAGSAPRGATAEDDRCLGERLLACPKNRLEHRLVVSAVRAALEPVCRAVEAGEVPTLVRLPETQHLYTPIRAELVRQRSILDLVRRLHPTPAVCGLPRRAARHLIERDEPERGWYAGGVGWMDLAGSGEFAVALRSALLDGDRAVVWAGAGIVAASEAEAEFEETEAKLGALFRFGGAGRRASAGTAADADPQDAPVTPGS